MGGIAFDRCRVGVAGQDAARIKLPRRFVVGGFHGNALAGGLLIGWTVPTCR